LWNFHATGLLIKAVDTQNPFKYHNKIFTPFYAPVAVATAKYMIPIISKKPTRCNKEALLFF
jgi:hypothetical protein